MARSQNPYGEFTPNSQGTIAKLIVREQLVVPDNFAAGSWEEQAPDVNHPVNTVIHNKEPETGKRTIVRIGPDPGQFLDAKLGVVLGAAEGDTTNTALQVSGDAAGGLSGMFAVLNYAGQISTMASSLMFGLNTGGAFGTQSPPPQGYVTPGTYDDVPIASSSQLSSAAGIVTIRGWVKQDFLDSLGAPFVFFYNEGTANVVFEREALTSQQGARFQLPAATYTVVPKAGALFWYINAAGGAGGSRWVLLAGV